MTVQHSGAAALLDPAAEPKAATGIRRVYVTDLILYCLIGVHMHERDGAQRVRINLELSVRETIWPIEDRLSNVLCYEELIAGIRALAGSGHVNLVETLAERIAGYCLEDPQVVGAKVRVDKLDVFADAESVGVEIERMR